MHGAENGLTEFLVAHLHGLTEGWILQQSLPEGGCRIGVATLEAPGLKVVGIAEVAVAVGEVVVPYGTCMQFATRAVGMHFLLIEIGTTLVAIGIQAEFGMDEIVDERCHVNIVGVAFHRVGIVVALNGQFHRVDKVLDIGKLLGLQILFLRIDARPDNLAGHDAIADAWNLRSEGGIVVVEGIDAQQIAACDVASSDVGLLQLAEGDTFPTPFDGFREDVDAAIVTIHIQFDHGGTRAPVTHVAPELEGQRVAKHRHVVVGRQQHPVAVGRHAQQTDIQLLAIFVARL